MVRTWLLLASMCFWGCTDPCRTAPPCLEHGLCESRGDVCVAHTDADCKASAVCKQEGRCTAFGSCVSKSDDDCGQSDACRVEGRCTAKDGACVASTQAACQASEGCSQLGRCTASGDLCVIGGDEDCKRSAGCREGGLCARGGPPTDEAPIARKCIKVKESDGNMGCPCGCDRSEAMSAELKGRGGEPALEEIEATLETIAKREAGGYITEAMVRHRLRLLDVEKELRGAAPTVEGARFTSASAVPEHEGELAHFEDRSVRVRTDLYVHGETTEFLHDREKALRAMFLLWLEIENLTEGDLSLAMPTIESRVPFPISRWYLAGSDGRRWDGVLTAGQTKQVHVIGYLGEPVKPGTLLEATVRFRSMVISKTARARAHWYEPYAGPTSGSD